MLRASRASLRRVFFKRKFTARVFKKRRETNSVIAGNYVGTLGSSLAVQALERATRIGKDH